MTTENQKTFFSSGVALREKKYQKISRQEAVEKGMPMFWAGAPCRKGHVDYRYTSNGFCAGCNTNKSATYKLRKSVGTSKMLEIDNLKLEKELEKELYGYNED